MEGQGAIHALDKDGNELPGTLEWMLRNPAKAPLIRAWRDDSRTSDLEKVQIEVNNADFGDPAPGKPKRLRVDYAISGRQETKTLAENGVLEIAAKPGTVVVERAFYGDLPNGAMADVTARVRKLVDADAGRVRWKVRDDVWVSFNGHNGRLTPGFGGGPDRFGPELGFGQIIGDASDDPVLIIKTAWGGKSLFADFRPPSSGGEVGPFYRQMVETVNRVMRNMSVDFPGLANRPVELSGFVWWQGWNDAYPKGAVPEYERNLVNLILDLRRDLHAPKLPVVVAELTGPWVQADHPWAEIRAAQAAGTDLGKHPELRGNVVFVPTRSFVRSEKDSPGGWPAHEFNNAETYFLVGKACGEAMKNLIEKRGTGAANRAARRQQSIIWRSASESF